MLRISEIKKLRENTPPPPWTAERNIDRGINMVRASNGEFIFETDYWQEAERGASIPDLEAAVLAVEGMTAALEAFLANYGDMQDGDGEPAPELEQARKALAAYREHVSDA